MLTLTTLTLTLASLAFTPTETPTYGAPIAAGDGSIQTYLITNEAGEPTVLGVRFALDFASLPPEPGPHGPGYEYLLPLPDGAAELLPFDHVTADWNPHGHVPANLYDVAHVDVHVYLLTLAERSEITPGLCEGLPLTCDALDRATVPLAASAHPPGYVDVAAVAPFMGSHLVDLRTTEFAPTQFDNTFLFGAWDGAIAFLEPMVTVAAFAALQGDRDCRAIANPQTFAEAGWYPNAYCVAVEDGAQVITLEDFAWYRATE